MVEEIPKSNSCVDAIAQLACKHRFSLYRLKASLFFVLGHVIANLELMPLKMNIGSRAASAATRQIMHA
jgi:hypothetical protein